LGMLRQMVWKLEGKGQRPPNSKKVDDAQ